MEALKIAKIENIFMLQPSQVGNVELKRGCFLPEGRVYAIDTRYKSYEKLPSGEPVEFKITEQDAAALILANKAVCVSRPDSGKPWVAVNVFGVPIKGFKKIVTTGVAGGPLKDQPAKEGKKADESAIKKIVDEQVKKALEEKGKGGGNSNE